MDTHVADLAPGDLNLADPQALSAFGLPPYRYFEMLRRDDPVHWNPAPPRPERGQALVTKGFWALTRHADVLWASQTSEIFSVWEGGPLWLDPDDVDFTSLESLRSGLMGMDPPDHTQYRRLVQPAFSPRNIEALEPVVRSHVARVVDRLIDRGEAEFVFDVAAELPMLLLCELMGIPDDDRPEYLATAVNAARVDDPELDQRAINRDLFRYCKRLIEAKRRQPDDTMLSRYANGSVEGRQLTDLEICEFFVMLSIAGHETTRNTISHFVRLVSEHPDQRRLLLEDLDARLPNAIEEGLRFSPPVAQFRRTATQDVEVRGTKIRAGDKVILYYMSANHDEEVFDDPGRFDILRPNARAHLSFGAGAHFCVGAGLARMQLRSVLGEVYRRVPDLDLTGAPVWMESAWLNALQAMPVTTSGCPVAHAE